MKQLLFLLAALLLVSGCAQTRLVSWETRKVDVPGQKNNILDLATGTVNTAIQSREYLLLYNAVYNHGIPANILAKINKNDRVAVLAAERDTLEYADFMHLFVNAMNRNLINAGYQVVDLRPVSGKFGLEPERLFASIDKLLIFTIWEAGSRSVIFDEKASVFSGFQMSLDVVEAKNNQFLASSPVFGSARNDFDKNEFDRFQLFTLSEVNASLPLIYADTSKKGVIALADSPQGRVFMLTVYNPEQLKLMMKITDISGNNIIEKEISFGDSSSGGYYSYVWDGKLIDGTDIQAGDYLLYIKSADGVTIGYRSFRVD